MTPDFESKLPEDVQKRKKALQDEKARQKHIYEHIQEMLRKERVIAYSEGVFHRAACEWLMITDQVRSYPYRFSLTLTIALCSRHLSWNSQSTRT